MVICDDILRKGDMHCTTNRHLCIKTLIHMDKQRFDWINFIGKLGKLVYYVFIKILHLNLFKK